MVSLPTPRETLFCRCLSPQPAQLRIRKYTKPLSCHLSPSILKRIRMFSTELVTCTREHSIFFWGGLSLSGVMCFASAGPMKSRGMFTSNTVKHCRTLLVTVYWPSALHCTSHVATAHNKYDRHAFSPFAIRTLLFWNLDCDYAGVEAIFLLS
ncbi:hypothetical protein J3A83DRAFT_1068938 [Scleroderma citrinum]